MVVSEAFDWVTVEAKEVFTRLMNVFSLLLIFCMLVLTAVKSVEPPVPSLVYNSEMLEVLIVTLLDKFESSVV